MMDATDLKAHPTASSLNKGDLIPARLVAPRGGMSSRLHGVCGSKGCPRRLYLSKGQCSDFAGADVLLKPQFWIRSRGGCDAGHGVGDADVANVDLGLCQGVSRQA